MAAQRQMRWTFGMIMAVMAAVLFLISMAPSTFGGAEGLNYAWRLGLFVLLLGAILDTRGLFLNRATISIFAPWCLLLFLHSLFFVFSQETMFLALRSVVLMFFVSALIGASAASAPESDFLRTFFFTVFLGLMVLLMMAVSNVLIGGWTWQEARLAKAELQFSGAFSANSAIFILVLSAFYLFSGSRRMKIGVLLVLSIASIILATRTPIAAAVLTIAIVAVWAKVSRLASAGNLRPLATLFSITILGTLFGFGIYASLADNPDIAQALAGRTNLWGIALDRWSNEPFFGSGPISIAEAMANSFSILNFTESWQVDRLQNLVGGGLHSVWFQTLAMYGIMGFLVLTWLFVRLLTMALVADQSTGLAAIVVYVMVGGHFEYAGLFANPNGPLDFMAAIAVFHSAATAKRVKRLRDEL
jgi:O-antigen ligase